MKKRLISLVAAAALVGGVAVAGAPQVAKAGTITVGGDTQVTLYGGVQLNTAYGKKFNPMSENVAYATNNKNVSDKARNNMNFEGFEMDAAATKFGFIFNNQDANISGKIEVGLAAGRNYLRHAFVKHTFDNGLYVLIGRTNNLFEEHSFDPLPNVTVGFNAPTRSAQLRVGGSFDLADSASLDFKFAFVDQQYYSLGNDNDTCIKFNRRTIPTIEANVGVNFDTGFGAPARIYVNGISENDKIRYVDGANNVVEKSKTGYAWGAGFVLPVSMVTVQSEYMYAKGMNKLAGVVSSYLRAPDSYYTDAKGNLKTSKFYAWNLEAQISPMACVSLSTGYDYARFKDTAEKGGDLKKNEAYFVAVSLKTTKYTTLTITWNHVKSTEYTGNNGSTKSYTGNGVFAAYNYSF